MKFNYLIPFFLLTFQLGCGKQQPLTTDYSPYKTKSGFLACKSLRIPADLKLNGNLLYYIPKCLSNKTETGEETLAGTVAIIETLGIDGLDSVTDLLKADPDGQTGEFEQFPIIRAFLTLTERGVVKDGYIQNDLFAKRFGFFQDFSLKMDPYWMVNLLVEMADNGRAKTLLDMIGPLLDDINIQNMLALNRALLVDENFQKGAVKSITKILEKKEIYEPLKKLVNLEKAYPLNNEQQVKCLDEWLDPVPRGHKSECLKGISTSSFSGVTAKNAADNYNVLLDDLNEERIRKLAGLVTDLSKAVLTLDSKERLATLKKLSSGGKLALNTQDGFVRNLVALLDLFLGQNKGENRVKISDLDFIMKTLKKSITATGTSDEVKALNHKVASARLHEMAEELFLNGGNLKSCNNLSLPSLKEIDINNQNELLKAMAVYFLPTESCPNNFSPLATIYFDSVAKKIGLNENCEDGSGQVNEASCISKDQKALIGKDLNDIDYGSLESFSNPNPSDLREIVLATLNEAKENLVNDPYFLHWLHFAEGKVTPEIIDHIINKIKTEASLTAEKIAILDVELESDKLTRGILRSDFIENLLNKKIDDLKIVAEEFNGFFKGDKLANYKALKVFSGAYFNGPLEKFISKTLFLENLSTDVINSFTKDEFRVKELLGRMKLEGVLISNSLLDDDDNYFNFKFWGEKRRSIKFMYKKNRGSEGNQYVFNKVGLNSKTYLKSSSLFKNAYLRFDKVLVDDYLLGVNLKKGSGDEFEFWVKNNLFEGLNDYNFWKTKFKHPGKLRPINPKFFEITPYSAERARMLALFYSKNYLMADAINPNRAGLHFNKARESRNAPIELSFLKLMVSNDDEWNNFLTFFPDFLKGSDVVQSYEEIDQIISDWNVTDYENIPWHKLPRYKDEINLDFSEFGRLGSEVIKLYNTINLFTLNSKIRGVKYPRGWAAQYMPLIGLKEECTLSDEAGTLTNCPLTFKNHQTAEGLVYDGFDNLKDFLSEGILGKFCPFISENGPVPSENYKNKVYDALKIKFNGESIVNVCGKTKNLFNGLKDQLPGWYHGHLLNDIYSLGENPKLKKGLDTLGVNIRYHKLKIKHGNDRETFLRYLVNSKGFLPSKFLKYYFRQTRDHRGFLTVFPGLINTYQNYLFNTSRDFGEKNTEEALSRFGAELNVNDELKNGLVQDFLENHLIKTQQDFVNRDAPAIELILTVLKNLGPEYVDVLTGLLAYPQDIESLSSFTKTYALFIRTLIAESQVEADLLAEQRVFWDSKGIVALKQVMRQENLRALTDIMGPFNFDEVNRGLKVLQKSLIKLGSPKEVVEILRIVKNFLNDEFLSIHEGNGKGTVFIFENLLRSIYDEVFFNLSNDDLNAIFDVMVKDGLVDFQGRPAQSIMNDFDEMNHFFIKNIFKILKLYQDHFIDREKVKEADENYFNNLVMGLLRPFKMAGAIDGTKVFAEILEDKDLGTWEGLLRPLLFEEKYQSMILKVLGLLNKVTLENVGKGLVESNVLIPSTNHSLKFLQENMEWSPIASPDVKYGIDSILRLSSPDNLLWEKNYSLLETWITQSVEIK